MIGAMTSLAYRLDTWLREHLGRPYNVILGVGLVLAIIQGVREVVDVLGRPGDVLKIAVIVAFEAVLLLNQMAQLHEHRQRRRKAPTPLNS